MSKDIHGDSSGKLTQPPEPIALREWTAREFADIYVRFYPQVLAQAKRYLTNHSQAEEVTQDAFLYLMTSLPEVDSEIGVLKLLKWKTRLLALDVISANSGAKFAPLDDELSLSSDAPQLSLQLERADDAAVVALALAKLEPRQREALIASLYEEKTTGEVAELLGINENATKQLIFRSKAAFKKALVGEAETQGLSLSQILSLAARKASRESGKYLAVASAMFLAFAISLGLVPNIDASDTQLASEPSRLYEPRAPLDLVKPIEAPSPNDGALSDPGLTQNEVSTAPDPEAIEESTQAKSESASAGATNLPQAPALASTEGATSSAIRLASLSPYLDLSVTKAEIVRGGTEFLPQAGNVLKIHSGVGLWAYVALDAASFDINAVGFEVMVDGARYFGSARSFGVATTESAFGYTLTYSATELFLIDADGNVFSEHELANSYVTISIEVNDFGEPLAANLFVNS